MWCWCTICPAILRRTASCEGRHPMEELFRLMQLMSPCQSRRCTALAAMLLPQNGGQHVWNVNHNICHIGLCSQ